MLLQIVGSRHMAPFLSLHHVCTCSQAVVAYHDKYVCGILWRSHQPKKPPAVSNRLVAATTIAIPGPCFLLTSCIHWHIEIQHLVTYRCVTFLLTEVLMMFSRYVQQADVCVSQLVKGSFHERTEQSTFLQCHDDMRCNKYCRAQYPETLCERLNDWVLSFLT